MSKQVITSLIFFILIFIILPIFNPIGAQDSSYNGSSNFDVGKYRTYNTKGYDDFDDKFYITPIENVLSGNGSSGNDRRAQYVDLREELALTGYESYCMQEDVRIKPEYSAQLIDTFLEQYPNGVNQTTFSKEKLGTQNADYPIWRDLDGKQFLMNSLEEYFGFKDVYEQDAAKSEVNSAAINSLLSQKQSCVQGWVTLGSERRACNRLQDQSTCEFTKRKIPGSSYEVHDVMGLLNTFTEGNWVGGDLKKGEEIAIKWCDVLYSEPIDPGQSELPAFQKELVQKIKSLIINVPTYKDKGYRYGFVVAAMETRIPEKPSPGSNEATLIFNFFTPKTETTKKDEVLVAAFKLPDIGTNKGPESVYGHEEWDDPLDLTRLVLTNDKSHAIQEADSNKKRNAILSAAIAAQEQTQDSRIFCSSGTYPGGGTNSCELPLPRALTDIINGSAVDCETKIEIVNEITDKAGLRDASDTYGKLFNRENGGQVLLNLFAGSVYNNDGSTPGFAAINPAEPKIETIWTIREPVWRPGVDGSLVHFYLVYPVGYELGTIEEAIKGAFFTEAQIATMNQDKTIVENFEITGQEQALDGGKIGWSFVDKVKTANFECGEIEILGILTGIPIPCIERPTIKIIQEGAKLDVLGGRLSWWLRKVQVSLSAKASFAHAYYESCKTMEEFLLGKCAGNSTGGGNPGTGSTLGDICEVAEAYNIDCDFLKAVYSIETCSGKNISVCSYGDFNCCNSIGFCGPMQAPGGTVGIVSSGDKLDICMKEEDGMDNFELAARWMLIKKWCNFNAATCLSSPNPYEWKESYIESEGDSSINTQEEVESFVLGWYGSINQPEPRFDGKTYVDAVMEYLANESLWGVCPYEPETPSKDAPFCF